MKDEGDAAAKESALCESERQLRLERLSLAIAWMLFSSECWLWGLPLEAFSLQDVVVCGQREPVMPGV
jgi:hypothetical protein